MISDPKTTPDSRAGRMLFAVLVAAGAVVRALPAVPPQRLPVVAGRWPRRSCRSSTGSLPAARYAVAAGCSSRFTRLDWRTPMTAQDRRVPARPAPGRSAPPPGRRLLRLLRRQGRHHALQQGLAGRARARRRPHRDHDGQRLPRRPARVRDGDPGADVDHARADPRRPTRRWSTHLDAYTAPRLVEYFDADPCARLRAPDARCRRPLPAAAAAGGARQDARAKSLGVTIEAPLHRRRIRHPDPVGAAELAASRPGCARTATASRPAPPRCSAATSGRTCASSSPR